VNVLVVGLAAQRVVRVRACLQGGRKDSSESSVDAADVLHDPSCSQSCGYCACRVDHQHPLVLPHPTRPLDCFHPRCSPRPIRIWSAQSLVAKTHPPSSGRIPQLLCQSYLRMIWSGLGQRGVRQPGLRSRSHSRDAEAQNQGVLHSMVQHLDLDSRFPVKSPVHQRGCQAKVREVHQSLGQQLQE
jgi:hypothetical protein